MLTLFTTMLMLDAQRVSLLCSKGVTIMLCYAHIKKNFSSPERIGFHSVATVWFSFHWLFWLLRKKGFNMVDNSAGSMISSATGIFLSFLHAKVGRERLVYFIVSYHIVLNLYFVKWIGLNLRRNNRRTNIDSDGGYCVIPVRRFIPRDVK